MKHDIRG